MSKVVLLAVVGIALAVAPAAEAHGRHHRHKHHDHHKHHAQQRAGAVHYGGQPGLGYWRKGPAKGYGFGFWSYKGDPFGSDDYYDGDRCYYVRHHDHCVKNKICSGFE